MIARERYQKRIEALLREYRVVAVLGARQTGKTTLARQITGTRRSTLFDLEDPADVGRLAEPMLALRKLRGLVVIDEVQRRPDLFPALRVLADRPRAPARFLILGSASPDLLKQGSETLAGRIAFEHLGGFDLEEVGGDRLDRLHLRGGFPRSFLSRSNPASFEWRENFIRTFLERDLPQLGVGVAASTMERFWVMLAHYHGQVWNASEFGRSFGVADTTVRRYLDSLASTYVVRILRPWMENLRKRQVKTPKVYVADSGLLHALLGLETLRDVERHPKLGASWEGFVLEQIIRRVGASPRECHFWATHQGAELDLLIVRGRRRLGFEIKRTDAPKISKSMRVALESLGLGRIDVVHAGSETYELDSRFRAVAARRIMEDLPRWKT